VAAPEYVEALITGTAAKAVRVALRIPMAKYTLVLAEVNKIRVAQRRRRNIN
jgi:hypothetical protein